MMTITTTGGETFTGADAKAVVRAMKDAAWNAPDRKRDYMAQVADRVEQMTGTRPPRGAEAFLASLQAQGLITMDVADDATTVERLDDLTLEEVAELEGEPGAP